MASGKNNAKQGVSSDPEFQDRLVLVDVWQAGRSKIKAFAKTPEEAAHYKTEKRGYVSPNTLGEML